MAEAVIVVSCGAQKRPQPAPAAQIYTGPYFVAALACARRLADDKDIRILSAKHGLLRLDTIVEPYEQRFGRPGAIDVETAKRQAYEQGLLERRVVAFCGRDYAAFLTRVFRPDLVVTPLAGIGGMGRQIQWFQRQETAWWVL
jgi:hypothetical protein